MKVIRRRCGISSVIGQVLVLAIVIGLMTGVIVFYNAILEPIQQHYKSTVQQAEVALKERFLIEDVKFFTEASVEMMNVTIFNFGDTSIRIVTVYINGIMLSPSRSNIIGQDQSDWFVVAYSWSSGGIYQVKVVTERGILFESAFSP